MIESLSGPCAALRNLEKNAVSGSSIPGSRFRPPPSRRPSSNCAANATIPERCGRVAERLRFASLRQLCLRHLDHQRQMTVDDASAAGADDRGRFAFLDNRRTIHVETGIKCVTIIDRGFREAMLGKVGESLSL